jgi:hypothetical protein
MKKSSTILKTLIVLLLLNFFCSTAFSQCAVGSLSGTITAPTTDSWTSVTATYNQHTVVNGLVAGETYEIKNDVGNRICVYDASNNLVLFSNDSYVTFVAPTGVSSIKVVICNNNGVNNGNFQIKCSYCETSDPTGSGNCIATNDSWTTLAISNPGWLGQQYFNAPSFNTYIRLTNVVANTPYTIFQGHCGNNDRNYVVITCGNNQTGTIVSKGYLPHSFVAPYTGDNSSNKYYLHIFKSHACDGTNFEQMCSQRFSFGPTIPLSVVIAAFTGEPTNNGNLVEWSTTTEINNDFFEVEATEDGEHYRTVGKLIGSGIGTFRETKNYSLMDEAANFGTTIYRLKQVDVDGKVSYPSTVAVNRKGTNDITVAPNPFKNDLKININVDEQGTYNFNFGDALGKNYSIQKELIKGYNQLNVDLSTTLQSGFYILKITNQVGEVINTTKIIKE